MVYVGKRAGEITGRLEKGREEVQFLYRIDENGRLLQSGNQPLEGLRSGQILGVEGLVYQGRGEGSALVGQLLGQVERFGYGGICCVFPMESRGFYGGMVQELDGICGKRGLELLVMEGYGGEVSRGKVLVSSALSGGTLAQRFAQVVEVYGGHRVVMDVDCMGEDFLLPCPLGVGRPLEGGALRGLMKEVGARVFDSWELCGRYFTYARDGGLHLVLFDDVGTVEEKWHLAKTWGLSGVFFRWDQGKDWGFL